MPKLWKQFMNGKILAYLKNRALDESTFVFLEIGLKSYNFDHKTSFYGIDEIASNMTESHLQVYK